MDSDKVVSAMQNGKINLKRMDELSSYKENGYLLKESFFSSAEINAILHDARSVFLNQFRLKGYVSALVELDELSESEFNDSLYRLFNEDFQCLSNCGKQIQHLISLHRLSLDQRITDMINELGIAKPVISTRPVLYFNHPKLAKEKVFYKVDAHQDWRSMQGSLNAIVVWIPLVDVPCELGALEILPGSHLHALRTDHIDQGFGMVQLSKQEQESMISVQVKAGDALFFSSFLIHQSGENSTDKPRWSTHFRYNELSESTFIERGYPHAYIYRPVTEQLTPNFPTTALVKDIFR